MSEGPKVAVVIPAFKQPSLVIEAIESVLRQRTQFDFRLVVVNDGCPFSQTNEVCRTYARAHPERFRYVYRKNGGLSAARNSGIDAALSIWPSVEVIQFLDSDDRLGPFSLQSAYDTLHANPEAHWAYPNCLRFGFGREYTDVAGPWNTLELMIRNYIYCASMVRRCVFERGLRYDEQMRLGYEDWNFWISAVEAGFRGIHAPDVDFQYRRRAESMLADTGRNEEAVTGYVRRVHASLYSPPRVLELEHAEMPRFAIVLAGEDRAFFTSDPTRLERGISIDELGPRLFRGIHQPQFDRFPPYLVITTRAVLDAASRARFAATLFWTLQHTVDHAPDQIAAAGIQTQPGRDYSLSQSTETSTPFPQRENTAVAMLSTKAVHSLLMQSGLAPSAKEPCGEARQTINRMSFNLTHPQAAIDAATHVLPELHALVQRCTAEYRRMPKMTLNRGTAQYRLECDSGPIVHSILGSGPLLPALLDRSQIHVAYVIPVCEFGGAERVTMNFARETRKCGWHPHLFVAGTSKVHMLPEFAEIFDTITIVPPSALSDTEKLLGLLACMNVIVNNNCGFIDPVLASVRRLGIKTFSQIHSVTIPHTGLPTGQPYEVLRYEHCLDGVLVVSRKLATWCRAWGIPDEKVIHVPNGPSFAVTDAEVNTSLVDRSERSAEQPLNVLFLGRFDREKGMDRLVALCSETKQRGIPVKWRIVGRRVLGSDGHPADDLGPIQCLIEPAAMTATALSRLYRWADVVVMVSRFEGVPLTILEAQRFGCVVISTNVGAIDELIEHERTGYLFSNALGTSELAAQMARCLADLQADRGRLMEIAHAAANTRRQNTWTQAFEPFARVVRTLFPEKSGANT